MWVGWISIDRSRRKELLALGIKLGKYNSSRYMDCIVPDEAAYEGLNRLESCFSLLDYYDEETEHVN